MKPWPLIPTLVACLSFGIARGECFVSLTSPCIEFESLFGYENTAPEHCGDCEPDGMDWACVVDIAYNYHDNNTDYYHTSPAPGETGSTGISIATGDPCIERRPCGGCGQYFPPAKPPCLFQANSTWQDFLWGSEISSTGSPCP
jgi:hypothetical protein